MELVGTGNVTAGVCIKRIQASDLQCMNIFAFVPPLSHMRRDCFWAEIPYGILCLRGSHVDMDKPLFPHQETNS